MRGYMEDTYLYRVELLMARHATELSSINGMTIPR